MVYDPKYVMDITIHTTETKDTSVFNNITIIDNDINLDKMMASAFDIIITNQDTPQTVKQEMIIRSNIFTSINNYQIFIIRPNVCDFMILVNLNIAKSITTNGKTRYIILIESRNDLQTAMTLKNKFNTYPKVHIPLFLYYRYLLYDTPI